MQNATLRVLRFKPYSVSEIGFQKRDCPVRNTGRRQDWLRDYEGKNPNLVFSGSSDRNMMQSNFMSDAHMRGDFRSQAGYRGVDLMGGIAEEANVQTDRGNTIIFDLRPGDCVQTLDNSKQTIRHILVISPASTSRILEISPGVFGAKERLPLLSDQLVFLRGWLLKALTSESELLADIGAFENGTHVSSCRNASTGFVIPVFDQPELIQCNGVWVACPGVGGGLVRRVLGPEEQRAIVQSGLFICRPDDPRARRGCGVKVNSDA